MGNICCCDCVKSDHVSKSSKKEDKEATKEVEEEEKKHPNQDQTGKSNDTDIERKQELEELEDVLVALKKAGESIRVSNATEEEIQRAVVKISAQHALNSVRTDITDETTNKMLEQLSEFKDNPHALHQATNNIMKAATGLNNISIDEVIEFDLRMKSPALFFDNRTLLQRMPTGFEVKSPQDYNELKELIKSAWNEDPTKRKEIRAAGTQYAFDNVTYTNGYLINMHQNINSPSMSVNENLLSQRGKEINARRHILKCEAGTSIEMIHDVTWPADPTDHRRWTVWEDKEKNLKYRMLQYMVGYHQLAVGGLVNVAAQGQGRLRSAFQNQVLSFHLLTLTADGKLKEYQIERGGDAAIYDKAKWDEYMSTLNEEDRVELIQDDVVFNSAVVGAGAFGVVYSYDFELMDAFFIKEDMIFTTYSEFKKRYPSLRAHEVAGTVYRMEIYISPYFISSGEQPVSLKIQYVASDDAKPESSLSQSLWGTTMGSFDEAYYAAALAVFASNHLPWLLPTILWVALYSTCHKDGLIADAIVLLSLGAPVAVPSQVSGMIVEQSRILEAIDIWCDTMNVTNHPCNTPCGVTWCEPSYGYIGMNSQKATAWMEMPYPDFTSKTKTQKFGKSVFPKLSELGATHEWRDSVVTVYKKLMKSPYNGRMHLGLSQTKEFFDKSIWTDSRFYNQNDIQNWLKNYRRFNASRIFSNDFTKSSGLDDLAFS